MLKKNLTLLIWIIGFQTIAYIMGQITQANIPDWYSTLSKPPLTPANEVFAVVWTILYILLAIVGWVLWQNQTHSEFKALRTLFSLQMIMNWLWTPLFFEFHLLGVSFYWTFGIIIITVLLIFKSWKHLRLISILLIPYLLWLFFALYLNGSIWMAN